MNFIRINEPVRPVTCHSARQSLIINKHSGRLIEINARQRRMLASGEIGLHTRFCINFCQCS